MKKVALFLLFLLLSPEIAAAASLQSVFSDAVKAVGIASSQQAACVVDTTGKKILSTNSDMQIIPASVSKLYTFDMALSTLPTTFHYTTEFFVKGTTVYINGGGDAHFIAEHLRAVIENIHNDSGVVLSTFVISPNLYFNWQHNPTDVQLAIFHALKADPTLPITPRISVVIADAAYNGKGKNGVTRYEFDSMPLPAILKQINDYSTNIAAEALFTKLGGAPAMTKYLKKTYNIDSDTATLTTGSGLTGNYTTCDLTIRVMQHLVSTLKQKGLSPTDVLSMPTVDPGVLQKRVIDPELAKSLVAKSGYVGSHHALAGIVNTKSGYMYFAVFTYFPSSKQSIPVKSMIDHFVGELLASYQKTLKAFSYQPDQRIFETFKIARKI